MEEKKYLNEEQYQENLKKLKKIGKIVLIVGAGMFILGMVLLIIGFSGFGKSGMEMVAEPNLNSMQTAKGAFGDMGLFALGGLLGVFGLFIAGIGVMVTMVTYRREIVAFTTQQVMPVAKEGVNEMAPTIGNVASEITKGIKKGLDESKK